jgi:hypothetical protein
MKNEKIKKFKGRMEKNIWGLGRMENKMERE